MLVDGLWEYMLTRCSISAAAINHDVYGLALSKQKSKRVVVSFFRKWF